MVKKAAEVAVAESPVTVTSDLPPLLRKFKEARRVSTPIVAISTPDPAATLESLRVVNGVDKGPVLMWDIIRGMVGVNRAGQELMLKICKDAAGEDDENPPDAVSLTRRPTDALDIALRKAPGVTQKDDKIVSEGTTLFMLNAQMYMARDQENKAAFIQAVSNTRDLFKSTGRMLIMLGISFAAMPAELRQDVLLLDEDYPTGPELEKILVDEANEQGIKLESETLRRGVGAIRGLPTFPARQSIAMSLNKKTGVLDLDELWSRKRSIINAAPGLSVYRGGATFKDIGGNENAKDFLRRKLNGANPPEVIVFVDEMEKMLAGATGGDLSGTSQEQHGIVLKEMQDNGYTGIIYLGPPGAGKSAIAKAAGPEGGIETVVMDMPLMKGSLVGETAARTNEAFKVVKAISGGKALFIATCNSIEVLSPELRRRFPFLFFFDLPSKKEREIIWQLYFKKYNIKDQDLPNEEGWTGAEIENCCKISWEFGLPLQEAAQVIVPVSVAAAGTIERLRREADGRYLNASKPGVYRKNDMDAELEELIANADKQTKRIVRDSDNN